MRQHLSRKLLSIHFHDDLKIQPLASRVEIRAANLRVVAIYDKKLAVIERTLRVIDFNTGFYQRPDRMSRNPTHKPQIIMLR